MDYKKIISVYGWITFIASAITFAYLWFCAFFNHNQLLMTINVFSEAYPELILLSLAIISWSLMAYWKLSYKDVSLVNA